MIKDLLLRKEIITTYSIEDIENVSLAIKEIILSLDKSNHIVLLNGDLGSGKTAFVKSYVSLFCDDMVTSPTFSVVHEYSNNIFHYDLYQKTWNDLLSIGMIEYLFQDGVHFIEWPSDKLEESLQSFDCSPIVINISQSNINERVYSITYE